MSQCSLGLIPVFLLSFSYSSNESNDAVERLTLLHFAASYLVVELADPDRGCIFLSALNAAEFTQCLQWASCSQAWRSREQTLHQVHDVPEKRKELIEIKHERIAIQNNVLFKESSN